jgi:hypothetical protein
MVGHKSADADNIVMDKISLKKQDIIDNQKDTGAKKLLENIEAEVVNLMLEDIT